MDVKPSIKFVADESDDEDVLNALTGRLNQPKYYASEKVLGKLYRAIDERAVFSELQEQSSSLVKANPASQTVLQKIWAYVENATKVIQWEHHTDWARGVQEA